MEIKRDAYLRKLIDRQHNGLVKVITGIRRCGKSYLLFELFYKYLKEQGVDDSHIIKLALDDRKNKKYRNPDELCDYVHNQIVDHKPYYILLDGSENKLVEPRGYDLNPDAFVAFLEEGVKNYKK